MFILNLLILFILIICLIIVIDRFFLSKWLSTYYIYTGSSKYNAEKDFRLLNTLVSEQVKAYVEKFVTGGSMDRDNIKLAIIPATSDGVFEHINEIYQIVKVKLAPIYLQRLQTLYMREIDQYLYLACKDEYIRILSEIKSTKRVIARDELNSKEFGQIKEIFETIDIFGDLEYDPVAIESLFDQFSNASQEDMFNYENSQFDSIQQNVNIYKNAQAIFADKNLDPKTFFNFLHKQRGE